LKKCILLEVFFKLKKVQKHFDNKEPCAPTDLKIRRPSDFTHPRPTLGVCDVMKLLNWFQSSNLAGGYFDAK
jgi:hypothetical protein